MPNRYAGILFSLILTAGFVIGLFIQPAASRANPGAGWQGEYFANETLQGTPVVTVTDEIIDMNWFTGAPYTSIPADFFSVRWTANVNFTAGIYRFRVGADDGIRLLIDDKPVIDAFTTGTFRTFTRDIRMPEGEHQLVVEYFEEMGLAGVLVDWSPIATPGEVMDLDSQNTEAAASDSTTQPSMAHVATSITNVYASPRETARRVTQVRLYQQYPILGISTDGAWYNIQLAEGYTGWIARNTVYRSNDSVLSIIPEADTKTEAAYGIAAADLKLRLNPQDQAAIGSIPQGEQFQIHSRNSNGLWLYVQRDSSAQVDAIEGWVFAPYVQVIKGKLLNLEIR